jgi:hypothetical protein
MKNVRFLFLGAALTIAGTSVMLAGCGDDTTGTGGGSTGTGGEAASSTTGAGGETATTATGTGTSTGTGMTAVLDCPSYCTEVMTNCTGANEQYKSMEACAAVCAAFTPGTLGATDGNTLACRLYHGGAPAVAMAATHCPHAGPTGGDKNVMDTAPDTCGEGCDAFCSVAQKVCTGAANSQYADKETCLTDCKKFKVDAASYSTANVDKDDFGCRFYHLTVAATDAASATAHCPHIKSVSPTCIK